MLNVLRSLGHAPFLDVPNDDYVEELGLDPIPWPR